MNNSIGMTKSDVLQELLRCCSCTMAFQPIVGLRRHNIRGFEALLRGNNGTSVTNPDLLFNQSESGSDDTLLKLDMAAQGFRFGHPQPAEMWS